MAAPLWSISHEPGPAPAPDAAVPFEALARRAAALAGAAAVLLVRGTWLVPVASANSRAPHQVIGGNGHGPTCDLGPLALGDPALAWLAPVRAVAEQRPIDSAGEATALWPLLAQPHSVFPLVGEQAVCGVLVTTAVNAPDQRDALVDLSVLGAANVRASLERTEHGVHQLAEVIVRMAAAIEDSDQIAATIAAVLGARGAVVLLPDRDHRLVAVGRVGVDGDHAGQALDQALRWVLLHNEPRLIAAGTAWSADPSVASPHERQPANGRVLLWPLARAGRAQGVLAIVGPRSTWPLTERDAALLRAVAALTTTASLLSAGRAAAGQTRAQLDALLDAGSRAVTIVDHRQRVVALNQAARTLWGLRDQVVGLPLASTLPRILLTLLDGQGVAGHDLPVLQAVQTGQHQAAGLRMQHSHAPRRHIDSQAIVLRDADGRVSGALAIDRDVTQLEIQERLAMALAALAAIDTADASVATVAQMGVTQVALVLETEVALLWLVDHPRQCVRVEATSGLAADHLPAAVSLADPGPLADAVRTRTVHLIEETGIEEPLVDGHWLYPAHEDAVSRPATTALVVPLVARGMAVGVVSLLTGQTRSFADCEIECAQHLAQLIALMLDSRLVSGATRHL